MTMYNIWYSETLSCSATNRNAAQQTRIQYFASVLFSHFMNSLASSDGAPPFSTSSMFSTTYITKLNTNEICKEK